MPRAYIAAPFTSRMSDKKHGAFGEINDQDYKKFLEGIESVAKDLGFSTCLPHRDISNWGTNPETDFGECDRKYLDEITASDVFIAYPEKSRGVHIELGWAIAKQKKIILLFRENFDLGTFIPGLGSVADVDMIEFKDIPDLETKLKECLLKARNGK